MVLYMALDPDPVGYSTVSKPTRITMVHDKLWPASYQRSDLRGNQTPDHPEVCQGALPLSYKAVVTIQVESDVNTWIIFWFFLRIYCSLNAFVYSLNYVVLLHLPWYGPISVKLAPWEGFYSGGHFWHLNIHTYIYTLTRKVARRDLWLTWMSLLKNH